MSFLTALLSFRAAPGGEESLPLSFRAKRGISFAKRKQNTLHPASHSQHTCHSGPRTESRHCHSEQSEESLSRSESQTSSIHHPAPSIPHPASLSFRACEESLCAAKTSSTRHPASRTPHPSHSEQSEESLLRSESQTSSIHHPAPSISKSQHSHHLHPSHLHLYNWNKQLTFNVPVFKVTYSYTQAPAKGFGVFKGGCIERILCSIGLHKTLPSHSSEKRWRSLYPKGIGRLVLRTFRFF